jgi:hypothetical protein
MFRNFIRMAIATVGTLVLALFMFSGEASAQDEKSEQPASCGLAWRVVESANYDANSHTLEDVVALAPDDAWAVGYHVLANSVNQTYVQHWDGNEWTVFPSPNFKVNDIAVSNSLHSVAAVSSDDVWAAGYFQTNTATWFLIIHWNGTQWTTSSFGEGGELRGITAISSNDVWAVGSQEVSNIGKTFTRHWNGTAWSTVSSPNVGTGSNFLYDVTTAPNGDLWAVGFYLTGNTSASLVLKHSQSGWTLDNILPAPGPGSRRLYGVAVAPGGAVWAVGYYANDEGIKQTFILRRLNGSWTIIASPNVYNEHNELFDLAVVADNNIWAVGYNNAYNNDQVKYALALHWDGSSWTAGQSASPSLFLNELHGVTVISGGEMWAVGYSRDGAGKFRTMAQRWSDPCACELGFSDLPADSTFYPYVRCLACQGIITGYDDGTFRPNANITRGQLSKIVSNAIGLNGPAGERLFEDVPAGSTFYDYIQRLAQLGVVSGYPCGGNEGEPCSASNYPYFRPNGSATRSQIAKIVSNAAGFSEPQTGQTFEDVAPGSTFHLFIERLASRGVMAGYDCGGEGEPCGSGNRPYFRPGNNATRGQLSKIASKTFFPDCQMP